MYKSKKFKKGCEKIASDSNTIMRSEHFLTCACKGRSAWGGRGGGDRVAH